MRTLAKVGLAVLVVLLGGLGTGFYWVHSNGERDGRTITSVETNAASIREARSERAEYRRDMIELERRHAENERVRAEELGRMTNAIEGINHRLDRQSSRRGGRRR